MERLCGEIGLSLFEFYELSPRQFENYAIGYIEAEERKSKSRLEEVRSICYWSVRGHLKEGVSPTDLLPFPWDEQKSDAENLVPTLEEVEAVREFWKNVDKKRNAANS